MSDHPAVSIAQTLEALTREVREMKAETDEVKAENARLHRRLRDIEGSGGAVSIAASPSEAVEPVTEVSSELGTDRLVSRRGALRALGGAAAGGVGLAIGSTLLGAGPAAANEPGGTEGGALILGASGGEANTASSSTQVLTSSGVGIAGGTSAGGQSGVEGQDLTTSSPFGFGVTGTSDGGTGVVGTSDEGTGVSGKSTSSFGVNGMTGIGASQTPAGSAGVIGQDLATGAPFAIGVFGSSDGGTGVQGGTDGGTGVLGESNTGVGVAGGTSASGTYGVKGISVAGSGNQGTGGGGVWGDSSAGVGVLGTSSFAVGVFGETSASGQQGVAGSDTSGHDLSTGGTGVVGISQNGIGGQFQGGLAPLRLEPAGQLGPPTAAFAHSKGEIYIDEDVAIWICTAAGSPGTWREVTAAAPRFNNNNSGISGSLGQAGSVNLLSAPVRVFDSRSADTPAASLRPAGQLAAGTTTTLQITGAAVGGVSVPAGAIAVIGNVTSANPQGLGFLTLFPANATQPATSTLNFESVNIANSCVMTLSPSGQLKVNVGQHATDVIFDVTGFVF
jgi:hypothetical protein